MMMGVHTIHKLRRLYYERWQREWPESDSYLAELWLESRQAHQATRARVPPAAVWEDCLVAMRECHQFTPAPSC
jgi:hypothetical protein